MSATVITITESPPSAPMPPSPGQLLSARERGAVRFRDKVTRELSGNGPKRSSDHLLGYRHEWDEAVEWLRSQGAIR